MGRMEWGGESGTIVLSKRNRDVQFVTLNESHAPSNARTILSQSS